MGDCDWDPRKSGGSSNVPVYPGNISGGFSNNPFTPAPKPKFNPYNQRRTPNPVYKPAASSAAPYNTAPPLTTFKSSQRSENLLQDLRLKVGQNKQQSNGTSTQPEADEQQLGWDLVGETKSIPQLIRHEQQMNQVITLMGIFPEIERVWVTVDNKLFFWNYKTGQHKCLWKEPKQVINCVALVPNRSTATAEVASKYLLLVCTAVKIKLLVLTPGRFTKQYDVRPSVYEVPSDNVTIVDCVTGELSGRVFLAGMDGQVYELIRFDQRRRQQPCLTRLSNRLRGHSGHMQKKCITSHAIQLLPAFVGNLLTQDQYDRRGCLVLHESTDQGCGYLYALSKQSVIKMFHVPAQAPVKLVYTLKHEKNLTKIFRVYAEQEPRGCVLVAVDRNLQMRRFEIARGRRGVSLRKLPDAPNKGMRNKSDGGYLTFYSSPGVTVKCSPQYTNMAASTNKHCVQFLSRDPMLERAQDIVATDIIKDEVLSITEGRRPESVMAPNLLQPAGSVYTGVKRGSNGLPVTGAHVMLDKPRDLFLLTKESLKQWRKKTRDAAALKALHQNGEDGLEAFLNKYQAAEAIRICLLLYCGDGCRSMTTEKSAQRVALRYIQNKWSRVNSHTTPVAGHATARMGTNLHTREGIARGFAGYLYHLLAPIVRVRFQMLAKAPHDLKLFIDSLKFFSSRMQLFTTIRPGTSSLGQTILIKELCKDTLAKTLPVFEMLDIFKDYGGGRLPVKLQHKTLEEFTKNSKQKPNVLDTAERNLNQEVKGIITAFLDTIPNNKKEEVNRAFSRRCARFYPEFDMMLNQAFAQLMNELATKGQVVGAVKLVLQGLKALNSQENGLREEDLMQLRRFCEHLAYQPNQRHVPLRVRKFNVQLVCSIVEDLLKESVLHDASDKERVKVKKKVGKSIFRGILFDFLYGCKSISDAKLLATRTGTRDPPPVDNKLCRELATEMILYALTLSKSEVRSQFAELVVTGRIVDDQTPRPIRPMTHHLTEMQMFWDVVETMAPQQTRQLERVLRMLFEGKHGQQVPNYRKTLLEELEQAADDEGPYFKPSASSAPLGIVQRKGMPALFRFYNSQKRENKMLEVVMDMVDPLGRQKYGDWTRDAALWFLKQAACLRTREFQRHVHKKTKQLHLERELCLHYRDVFGDDKFRSDPDFETMRDRLKDNTLGSGDSYSLMQWCDENKRYAISKAKDAYTGDDAPRYYRLAGKLNELHLQAMQIDLPHLDHARHKEVVGMWQDLIVYTMKYSREEVPKVLLKLGKEMYIKDSQVDFFPLKDIVEKVVTNIARRNTDPREIEVSTEAVAQALGKIGVLDDFMQFEDQVMRRRLRGVEAGADRATPEENEVYACLYHFCLKLTDEHVLEEHMDIWRNNVDAILQNGFLRHRHEKTVQQSLYRRLMRSNH